MFFLCRSTTEIETSTIYCAHAVHFAIFFLVGELIPIFSKPTIWAFTNSWHKSASVLFDFHLEKNLNKKIKKLMVAVASNIFIVQT